METLTAGTKVTANGYPGTIVRKYDEGIYEVRLPGGVVVLPDYEIEVEHAAETLPAGITSFEPIPYGERRWNGATWAPSQVDRYNAELERIATRHTAGMDVQHLINGLYNMAHGFDQAGK